MSLFEDIQTLEERLQKELLKAGNYSSVTNFVQVYQQSVLQSLEGFTRGHLNDANLKQAINTALTESADFIDQDLVAEIEQGVNSTINDTIEFYEDLGVQPVDLIEGIQRRKELEAITNEFTNNMGSMRDELRDGTLQKVKEVIGRNGLDRNLLQKEILEFTDGRAHWARTNARMVVSSSNRLARDEMRESAGLQAGFYYGEVRDSTRAFCRACAGKTFNMKQIKNMSNGQGLDVKIYAGGWNCIHSWLWVDPEWDPELKKTMEENRPIVELKEDSLKLQVPQ